MEEDALKQQPRNQKERIKLRHNLRLKAQDIINWCWDVDKLGKMSEYLKATDSAIQIDTKKAGIDLKTIGKLPQVFIKKGHSNVYDNKSRAFQEKEYEL